jgi:hypothetical protein
MFNPVQIHTSEFLNNITKYARYQYDNEFGIIYDIL